MIKVRLEIPQQLKSGARYTFSADKEITKDSMNYHTEGSPLDQYTQYCGLGTLRTDIQALFVLECDVHVDIVIGGGKAAIEGSIKAITLESYQAAIVAVERLLPLLNAFPNVYPRTRCKLTYAQTVRLTSVKRAS